MFMQVPFQCLLILHHNLADALVSKQVLVTYPKCRYKVMRSCWDVDPKQRPTFSQLVTTITSVLNSLEDYLEVTTFVTEEQATNEMEKGKCDKEASQERDQTTETHFLTNYGVKNEGAEACAK